MLLEGTVTWYSCGVVKWNKCNDMEQNWGLQVVCIQNCVELSVELCRIRVGVSRILGNSI